MHTLESLKKKIKTTEDLLTVVKTMKSLAAVNIRQFENAAWSLEEYNRIVDLGWRALFYYQGGTVAVPVDDHVIFLVLGSDQGMCGRFNEVILELVLQGAKQSQNAGLQVSFWTVGERVRSALEDGHYNVEEHFDLPGSMVGINDNVNLLVQKIEFWRREKGVETLHMFYNQLIRGSFYQSVRMQLLPLDHRWLEKYREKQWPGRCLPRLGLSWEDLFRHLFRQYLFVSLYRSFAQSLASENAARLQSMQAAEKNILELKNELLAKFRETRQTQITAELLDIITGFEAMRQEKY